MVPPHPHPRRQQTSPARGQTNYIKRYIYLIHLMIFYHFCEKNQEGRLTGGLKRGMHENYSGCFPEGVQKEEIQRWRQARSRPGEKETLNNMLRENVLRKYKNTFGEIVFYTNYYFYEGNTFESGYLKLLENWSSEALNARKMLIWEVRICAFLGVLKVGSLKIWYSRNHTID